MKLSVLTKLMNLALAGEMLSYNEMVPYLDKAIDHINTELNSCYPVFSEMESEMDRYPFFPACYIRSVVIPYACWQYFVMDEEGMQTATQYQMESITNMFTMKRDMLYNIPTQYQADANRGSIEFQTDLDYGQRGLVIDGNDFCL